MALPSGILPWIEARFFDTDGAPLAGGTVETYAAGTITPKATWTDTTRTTAHTNPIQLDASGRPTGPVYLEDGGYLFVVKDADGVQQYTADNVSDIGMTWLSEWGVTLAAGARSVTSGYTVIATDSLITVASTGGANPCLINLPAATARLTPLCIKNVGTVIISVVPNGSDTIDGQSVFQIQKMIAPYPCEPTAFLVSDGTSAWHIVASHGMELGGGVAVVIPDMSYVALSTAGTTALSVATPTPIIWDVEDSDTQDLHSTSTNPTRVFTVPTGQAGTYVITAQVWYIVSSYPGARTHETSIKLNGSTTVAKTKHGAYGNDIADNTQQVTATLYLVEDDYVEIVAFANQNQSVTFTVKGGGTAEIYTWVTAAQIAAF